MKEKKANKTSYAHIFLGLGGSLFMIMLSSTNLYEIAELKTYDQRFLQRTAIFGPIRMDRNLATVNVDDRTLASEGRWQDWTRDKHAKIVRSIHEFGGRMVGFDVFFLEPSEVKVSQEQLQSLEIFNREEVLSLVRDYDGELASAFRESGIVYLGQYLDALEEGDHVRPLEPERKAALETMASKGLFIPYPEGREATLKKMRDIHPPLNSLVEAAKGVGFAQADPDVDGTRRKFPLVLFYEGRIVPSLALIMLCDYLQVPLTNIKVEEGEGYIRLPNAHTADGEVKDIEIPIDPKGKILVNWAGGFLETFQSFPHITISRLSEDRKALDALRIVKRIFVEHPEAQGDFEQLVALSSARGGTRPRPCGRVPGIPGGGRVDGRGRPGGPTRQDLRDLRATLRIDHGSGSSRFRPRFPRIRDRAIRPVRGVCEPSQRVAHHPGCSADQQSCRPADGAGWDRHTGPDRLQDSWRFGSEGKRERGDPG